MTLDFNGRNASNDKAAGGTGATHTTEKYKVVDSEGTIRQSTLDRCFEVMEAISKLDPEESQVVWCMVTDFVAAKNGIPANEIIETLVPLVEDVNRMMGPFFYDSYPQVPGAPAPAPSAPAEKGNT